MALKKMSNSRENFNSNLNKEKQRVNEAIRISQVRVISADGVQLGILNTSDALSMARQSGLDLVEVATDSKPPVCRIMDYGKFRYQQKKRLTKQHTHQSKLKEIRLRPKTGDHDLLVKVNKAREFLNNKDRVQLVVMFKGRELAHIDEGEKIMSHLIAEMEDISKIESPPKRAEKRIVCTLTPK
jgi:translation initiation factor IF-3